MKEDPRQTLNDQLLASELIRKEKQIASIKALPFGLGFYAIAGLMFATIIVGLSKSKVFDWQMTLIFLVSSLLFLLIVLSSNRINQKFRALIDLLGEEKLRNLDHIGADIDPEEEEY